MALVSENYTDIFPKKSRTDSSQPLICVNTKTHTFPGGDEPCQELAEVGSGVRVLLRERKSFQLGGRTPVLDVGFLQTVAVSLEEHCWTHRADS